MITQELIDYVKTQLSAGVAREKITSDLLGQGGWTTEQINEVFASISQAPVTPSSMDSELVENKMWQNWIPLTNKTFMIVSLVVMFGVHPFILATDALDLGKIAYPFYLVMFVPLLIFAAFYRHENKGLSTRYGSTKTKMDKYFFVLIIIRNIVFGLNFIPFIQVIGAMALVFGIIPYVIVYKLMERSRNKLVVAV